MIFLINDYFDEFTRDSSVQCSMHRFWNMYRRVFIYICFIYENIYVIFKNKTKKKKKKKIKNKISKNSR